jgi:cation diffusion facilitator family transporter
MSLSPAQKTIRSAKLSLLVGILVLAIKFYGYYVTQSQAVFSDALESIVNVITALVALLVMRAVAEPADEDHPYGHGKLEFFSAAFEGGLITFAALVIGFQAIVSLVNGSQLHRIDAGILYIAIASLLNLALAMHLRVVGKKYNSQALQASSSHILSDVWTTVIVIVGLALVKWTGWLWMDSAMALVLAIQLCVQGVLIVRRSAGGLIDEVDKQSLENLCRSFNKHLVPGLIDIHQLRMIRSGSFHHVDAHLVVPDFWDVVKVHAESHEFETQVVSSYPFDGEIAFHVDPCQRLYCKRCSLADCPIRVEPFVEAYPLTVDRLIKPPPEGMKANI